jgi:acyl-CoA dehydrogenase
MLQFSDRTNELLERLNTFMDANFYPNEEEIEAQIAEGDRWAHPPLMEKLKEKARSEGLWNLFLPESEHGAGLSNFEYAPLCEVMGRSEHAPEIFNCSAPDTGNMETLILYGTEEQKERWLKPLLAGEIRSGFAMTEPDVASSDATNIACSMVREGNDYLINGRKWFTTGGMRDNCEILIVMGKTDPDNPDRHRQQSMILVPRNTPGVEIVRHVHSFGYNDAPFGEAEISFDNVRVPAENILLGEGRGFEIAQGRLGPGRIHHCMRLIGCAQRALELACRRVEERATFGRKISRHQSVREDISRAYCKIEQARLLTLLAADRMDKHGNKVARDLIAAIKITAPVMACEVIDDAIQMHGAAGLTEDFFLAEAYNYARQIRLADGPDQVHMMSLGKQIIQRYSGAT